MKHGGKRSNAGRKPTVPGGKPRHVVLSDEAWKKANAGAARNGKGVSQHIDAVLKESA